jgi:histidine triad (HIT) family protein
LRNCGIALKISLVSHSIEVVGMDDCIFCKIIKGSIPCEKVYEDKDTVAFLTIGPVNKGHTLVVPKKHVKNLLDMDEKTINCLFLAVKKLVKPVKLAFNADGVNMSMNNEPASGQVVMHAHVHLIPRFHNDGLSTWPHKTYADGEMKGYGEKIRSCMKI